MEYFNHLNETSVYYNFLTIKLLFDDKNDETSIIKIFFRYMIKKKNIVAF
jgi:hypothetical protein